MEYMLENLLYIMALENLYFEDVDHLIELLLESNHGREKGLNLYKKLGYGSFSSEIKEINHSKFLNEWSRLAKNRNQYAHGKYKLIDEDKPETFINIVGDSLAVFSYLHNKYNAESLRYKIGKSL